MEKHKEPSDNISSINEVIKFERLSIDQPFTQDEPIIDQIMNKSSCLRYRGKVILLAGLLIFIEGMEVSLSGLLFVPIMFTMKINRFEACVATSMLLLAMAFGSILSGYFSYKGRKRIISISLYIVLIGTFLSFIENITLFIILRAVIGLGLGLIIPMANNLLVESLSTSCRGFWITFVSLFFYLGAIFTTVMMKYFYLFNWDTPNPFYFFLSLSFPILITTLLISRYLQETPRLLLTKRQYDEAFSLLESINGSKLEEEQKDAIVKEQARENKSIDVSIKSIFDSQYRKTTVILTLVWIFYAYLVNGGLFQFMAGLLYSSSLSTEYLNDNYSIHIAVVTFIYSVFMISNLISGCLSEIKCIGRKGLILFGFFCSVAALSLYVFTQIHPALEFIPAAFFINMSLQITNVYTCEIYPTKIRDLALGYFYFISRITGFIANILSLLLLEHNRTGHVRAYINIAICLIGFVITLKLPVDTFRRALDTKIEQGASAVNNGQQHNIIMSSELHQNTENSNSTRLD